MNPPMCIYWYESLGRLIKSMKWSRTGVHGCFKNKCFDGRENARLSSPTAGSGYAVDRRPQLMCSRILGAKATLPRSFCWPVISYGGDTKERGFPGGSGVKKICLIQCSNWACTLRRHGELFGRWLLLKDSPEALTKLSETCTAMQALPSFTLSFTEVTRTSQSGGPSSLLWLPLYFLSQVFPWIKLNKPPVYLTLSGFCLLEDPG